MFVKLFKGDKTIIRSKIDWEKNYIVWKHRGWDVLDDQPKEEIKQEDKPKKTRRKKDD